jgi:glycosyltransferase involved in cell wall biosynthesis
VDTVFQYKSINMTDGSPRFSLIVATMGRTAELSRLLDSLQSQSFADFEVIVVDQNKDERLSPILKSFAHPEKLKHVRCDTGVSKARNAGIRHAVGQIIAFPDDDCWYPPTTLENVDDWFHSNSDYDILSLTSRDEKGELSGNRWHSELCDITITNVFRTSACYCFFVRATDRARTVTFDEQLGPGAGTRFPASEDTDYVLSAMQAGIKGKFVKQWHIGHPTKDARSGSISATRAFEYGLGMGRVQGKHKLFFLWVSFVLFDMSRALIMALRGKRTPASLWFAHGKGILKAYFAR